MSIERLGIACVLAISLHSVGEASFAPVPDLPEHLPHPTLRALSGAQYALFRSKEDAAGDRKDGRIHTGGRVLERLAKLMPDELKALLPQPILNGQPGWLDLYWQSWHYACLLVRRYDQPAPGGRPFNTYILDEDCGSYDACFYTFDHTMRCWWVAGRGGWCPAPTTSTRCTAGAPPMASSTANWNASAQASSPNASIRR